MAEHSTFEEELNRKGHIVYTNHGVSMLPLLRQGRDVMIIEKKGPNRCGKYDVVLFKRPNGQYILHRILKVREQDYYIVGDNCRKGEYVREEQILGILTGIVRKQKRINVTDRTYRLYVHLWCDLFPIRSLLILLRELLQGFC
ncbi:MAG: S24/S26 family peptidase [Blautia sp.]|nr:S24/S26 family peptidase [Blautia sp.]